MLTIMPLQMKCRRLLCNYKPWKDDAYQDVVAPMAPQALREDAAQPSIEAEGGLMNPEHFMDPACLDDDNLSATDEEHMLLNDNDDDIGAMSRHSLTDREFRQLIASLNTKQRNPFDIVVHYTRELHKHRMKIRHEPPEPFHLFVTGEAGTGKSHVIRAIKEHM